MDSFHIDNPETRRLIVELADISGSDPEDAVRLAVEEMLRRKRDVDDMMKWLERVWASAATYKPTGKVADKYFYDSLYDE